MNYFLIMIMIFMNMFLKYFMMMNLILFNLSPLFFTDLMLIWFFMEINNFLFIYLLSFSMKNKKMIFFYFLIQIIASFMIIYIIIMNNIFMFNMLNNLLIMLSLLMKLGAPPFHFWLPLLSKHIPWNTLFILLTLMKITPFYMISLIKMNTTIIYLTLILCSIIPPYIMLNLTNLKMIMSYSSINQTSWMILLIFNKYIMWLTYFIFYSLISLCLFLTFNIYKIFLNNNFISNFNTNFYFILLSFMFNMGGMPPFSFFFMKWYSMFIFIMNSNMLMILIMMMFSSLIMLYIYMNMMINFMFLHKFKSKIYTFNNLIMNNLMTFIIFLMLFLSMIMFIF